jgi:hypothetical protein
MSMHNTTVSSLMLVLAIFGTGCTFDEGEYDEDVFQQAAIDAPSEALTLAESEQLEARIQAELVKAPGGKRIGLNEIAWKDGNVVMTIGIANGEVGAQAYGPCDAGWYCVYEAWHWNDYNREMRKLRFRDCSSSGVHNNLDDWGFGDRASSWDNRSRAGVEVYDYFVRYLFLMHLASKAAEVAPGANDRAVHMYAYCW